MLNQCEAVDDVPLSCQANKLNPSWWLKLRYPLTDVDVDLQSLLPVFQSFHDYSVKGRGIP